MKKFMMSAAISALLAFAPINVSDARTNEKTAIFVVIENGGVVTDREAAKQTINFVLGELVKLRRRRATRDAEIHIVLSANPTEVSWAGTPQQLFDQGQQVMKLIEFRDTCSDLVLAWSQVSVTTRITMPSVIQLIAVGPMIHAGFPCDEGDTTITLPQQVPVELKFGELAGRASLIRLLNVHADQDEIYLDYLRDAGVMDRARAGVIDFDLMDAARTRAAHGRILEDR